MGELPTSYLHHAGQLSHLSQKEKTISKTAERYMEYFLRILSSLEAKFDGLKDANYQLVEQVHQAILNIKPDWGNFIRCLEQLENVKREIEIFESSVIKNPSKFIDRNTGAIKAPANVLRDMNLIDQENVRDQEAAALKTKLETQYPVDHGGRTRDRWILIPSLVVILPQLLFRTLNKFARRDASTTV